MKLVIIGSGIAGQWLALHASRAGHEVHLVCGEREPAHFAGLAMIRPSYYDKELRPLVPQSVRMWEDENVNVFHGAEVTRWDSSSVKFQKDWFAFDPRRSKILSSAENIHRYFAEASPLVGGEVLLQSGNSAPYTLAGDAVVWCTGEAPGGSFTYGETWVNQDPEALGDVPEFRVHHMAPYKTLVAVRYEGSCRIGSSSSSTPEKARAQSEKFFDKAIDLGWVESRDGWEPVAGRRFKRDEFLTGGGKEWTWAGFHRSGYGVVPALSLDVLKKVERGAQA